MDYAKIEFDPEDPDNVRPPERYRNLCYADLVEQIEEDWQEAEMSR